MEAMADRGWSGEDRGLIKMNLREFLPLLSLLFAVKKTLEFILLGNRAIKHFKQRLWGSLQLVTSGTDLKRRRRDKETF